MKHFFRKRLYLGYAATDAFESSNDLIEALQSQFFRICSDLVERPTHLFGKINQELFPGFVRELLAPPADINDKGQHDRDCGC